jgi:hypothetical protein
MESHEIMTPLVREDFSDGDRIYSLFNNVLTKGTVVYDPDEYKDQVSVWMDAGYQMPLHLSCFIKEPDMGHWGKLPHLDQIQVGTILSHLQEDGTRTYAEVRDVIPNERIRMKRTVWPNEYFDHTVPNGGSLEDSFLDWEIEG